MGVVYKAHDTHIYLGIGAVYRRMGKMDLAIIYTLVGEYDKALDKIEFLLQKPSRLTVNFLRLHPIWKSLRTNPRFKQLLAKYSTDI